MECPEQDDMIQNWLHAVVSVHFDGSTLRRIWRSLRLLPIRGERVDRMNQFLEGRTSTEAGIVSFAVTESAKLFANPVLVAVA